MTITQFISEFQSSIPLAQAEDFDNVGLLCGDPSREITGILVCHDALEKVVEEAIKLGHNLIVCFHPILFKGIKSLTGKNYVERALLKAIENKIAIFAVHTALDNDYLGVNYRICNALGLKEQKVLDPKKEDLYELSFQVPSEHRQKVLDAVFGAGAGSIGYYDRCSFSLEGEGQFRPRPGADPFLGDLGELEKVSEHRVAVILERYKKGRVISALLEAHPYEEVAYQMTPIVNENQYLGLGRYGELERPMESREFLEFVKETFKVPVIRHSSLIGRPIRKVGVLGGSGAQYIPLALSKGIDAFITGDVKYHDFFQGENRMVILDIGHYESEQFVVGQLFDLLSEKFPKFAISKSRENTNPVNYFQ